MGTDRATGKTMLALPEPGGALERMADVTALETATVVTAIVGEILEAGKASDAELSSFVPTLHAALCEVTEVAARLLSADE
ncbi:hypothetical protein [Streptomyces sp. CNZ748]|uniref:hypothetical protein n=1 Tax=Streptomyces sp. CNZ748 TaxID=2885160 RepID=UPI001E3143D3|nr:hypothetical protein [Streptomyces sp. CNZ748]